DQNKSERMTGAEMVEELNKLVAKGEIDDEEVPQVKTTKKIDEIQLNREETDKSNSSAIPCNNRKRDKNINHEISEVESRNLGCNSKAIHGIELSRPRQPKPEKTLGKTQNSQVSNLENSLSLCACSCYWIVP
ncbi:18572_t:CDS:2, partial [Gigaspora rosea]